MSWRSVQLGNNLCDQDRIIIDLFQDRPVKVFGVTDEFLNCVNVVEDSSSVIAIFNSAGWLSELIDFINYSLNNSDEFYIGVNRYCVLGNNTNIAFGKNETVSNFVLYYVKSLGFDIVNSGSFDFDHGKHFNFVQPLTWIYGTNKNNKR